MLFGHLCFALKHIGHFMKNRIDWFGTLKTVASFIGASGESPGASHTSLKGRYDLPLSHFNGLQAALAAASTFTQDSHTQMFLEYVSRGSEHGAAGHNPSAGSWRSLQWADVERLLLEASKVADVFANQIKEVKALHKEAMCYVGRVTGNIVKVVEESLTTATISIERLRESTNAEAVDLGQVVNLMATTTTELGKIGKTFGGFFTEQEQAASKAAKTKANKAVGHIAIFDVLIHDSEGWEIPSGGPEARWP